MVNLLWGQPIWIVIVIGLIGLIVIPTVAFILWRVIVITWQKNKNVSVLVAILSFALFAWFFVTFWDTIILTLCFLVGICLGIAVLGLLGLILESGDRRRAKREARRAKKLKDWTGQDYEDFWNE